MRRYDRIYLSPHLDDAVFSCGGRIHQETRRGLSVLIVTVATADAPEELSAFAERFHRRCGLGADATAVRREEDRRAAGLLGAEVLHLGLADAAYRRDPETGRALYGGLPALLGRPKRADAGFAGALGQRLEGLPEGDLLLLPMAIGGHVDHRVTRRVAEVRCADRSLLWWEDFPYVAHWSTAGRRRPGRGWTSEVVRLSPEAVAARCRAMAAYLSQVPLIFGGQARMRRLVEARIGRLGGERYWRRRATL